MGKKKPRAAAGPTAATIVPKARRKTTGTDTASKPPDVPALDVLRRLQTEQLVTQAQYDRAALTLTQTAARSPVAEEMRRELTKVVEREAKEGVGLMHESVTDALVHIVGLVQKVSAEARIGKACQLGLRNCASSGNPAQIDDFVAAHVKFNLDFNATDDFGHTPLMLACEHGHDHCVSKLLGCGARHDLHSTLGWTALHWACIKDSDGHVESLKLLLKHGVDVNAHSVASKSLQSQASRLHLTANTALMNVCENGKLRCARLLLDAGADRDALNNDGKTALEMGWDKGHVGICALFDSQHASACRVHHHTPTATVDDVGKWLRWLALHHQDPEDAAPEQALAPEGGTGGTARRRHVDGAKAAGAWGALDQYAKAFGEAGVDGPALLRQREAQLAQLLAVAPSEFALGVLWEEVRRIQAVHKVGATTWLQLLLLAVLLCAGISALVFFAQQVGYELLYNVPKRV